MRLYTLVFVRPLTMRAFSFGAVKYLVGLALLLAIANCGAGGILTMGDQWCARHPSAPPSKCGPKPVTVWYQPQMMNGPPDDEHHIPAQAIVIPDPDE